jgi:hypothetical protein
MAVNISLDQGVPRATASDTIAYPVLTDIGVPTEGLATAISDATRTVQRRLGTYPANRTKASLGVAVPLNPVDGVVRN